MLKTWTRTGIRFLCALRARLVALLRCHWYLLAVKGVPDITRVGKFADIECDLGRHG